MQKTNKKDYIDKDIKFYDFGKEKGITLVALVITVIILLILTGLAIKVVVDDGVIKNAEETVNKANEQTVRETETMNNMLSDWTNTTTIKDSEVGSGTSSELEETEDLEMENSDIEENEELTDTELLEE